MFGSVVDLFMRAADTEITTCMIHYNYAKIPCFQSFISNHTSHQFTVALKNITPSCVRSKDYLLGGVISQVTLIKLWVVVVEKIGMIWFRQRIRKFPMLRTKSPSLDWINQIWTTWAENSLIQPYRRNVTRSLCPMKWGITFVWCCCTKIFSTKWGDFKSVKFRETCCTVSLIDTQLDVLLLLASIISWNSGNELLVTPESILST